MLALIPIFSVGVRIDMTTYHVRQLSTDVKKSSVGT